MIWHFSWSSWQDLARSYIFLALLVRILPRFLPRVSRICKILREFQDILHWEVMPWKSRDHEWNVENEPCWLTLVVTFFQLKKNWKKTSTIFVFWLEILEWKKIHLQLNIFFTFSFSFFAVSDWLRNQFWSHRYLVSIISNSFLYIINVFISRVGPVKEK